MRREVKVGLLLLAALVVAAVGLFLVGSKDHLFALKNRYLVRLESAAGLNEGNPVQLNGVNVGRVESISLPEAVAEENLTIWLQVERRYADRIRSDSRARIKTLGLLGDKYVEITSGSPDAEVIASGGEIPAAPATDVDKLLASGEDVVANIVSLSHSLNNILGRLERGEGLLGLLISEGEATERTRGSLVETLESVERISGQIESGKGTLGRLIYDDTLAQRMSAAVDRFDRVATQMTEGEGLLPSLLNDAAIRDRTLSLIEQLDSVSARLDTISGQLAGGDGLLPRLLNDEVYGRQVSAELESLIHNLNVVSSRLERGDGTLGQLINDPQAVEALNDLLVGVNESRLLRWLIRNRQKKGIEKRYDAAIEDQSGEDPSP
ncbi:MAG: MlaD family protein [Thermoanaerobaculia bacterium]